VPQKTPHVVQQDHRARSYRLPSCKQRKVFEAAPVAMACPDGCPDPDQTIRDKTTHAALIVDRQELRRPSLGAQQHPGDCPSGARISPGGIPATEGTDTIRFLKEGCEVTYLRICSTDLPQKKQTRRVRFPSEVSTKTASIATAFALPIE
jgi:hypothetical protein